MRKAQTGHRFGALADTRLVDDFRLILESPERDDVNQVLTDIVLDILGNGEALPKLASVALAIVRDDTRWPRVRRNALGVWLKLADDPQVVLALLSDITEGRVTDRNDELVGMLLKHLYPKYLDPNVLLQHLHPPQDEYLFGSYLWFWEYDLLERVPDAHLPDLLDGLARRGDLRGVDCGQRMFERLAGMLLKAGIEKHGDRVDDVRLFEWLGIGVDEFGHIGREESEQTIIAEWLEQRPERYKRLLSLCSARCEQHQHPEYCVRTQSARLRHAKPPEDIGLWHFEQATLTGSETLARIHLAEAVGAFAERRGDSGLSLERLETWVESYPEREDWLRELLYCEISPWRHDAAIRENTRKQKLIEAKRKRTIALRRYLSAIRAGSAPPGVMHQLAGVWENRYMDIHGETPAERFGNYCENGGEAIAAAETGFRLCPERTDLPTVDEIIALKLKKREYLIGLPCLVGMELRWQDGPEQIECLSESILGRMIAFRLIHGVGNTPGWFTYLVRQRPELVSEVLIAYASATLKTREDHIDSIHPLAHDPEYRAVAVIVVPRLLKSFPVRVRTSQLYYLDSLLKAALRYTPTALQPIIEKKLGRKGMDVAQKVYWHAAATLLDPETYETVLWRYVAKSEVRTTYLADFLGDRDGRLSDYSFSAKTIGKLIEIITPHAQIERPRDWGWVTPAMQRGDQVRTLIRRLGAMLEPEAEQEIERLLGLPTLVSLKRFLEDARHEHRLRRREHEFRFLPTRGVARVLANEAPASPADLAALVLHHLDDIGQAIRRENDDGFRAFWNVEKGTPIGQREENLCRDELLTRLRPRLAPLGIDCQPEGDYVNDKRADIRISYRNEFELPIEIKRDSNPSLWTALREQLIEQYVIAPKTHGHGIYLVLWFGGGSLPRARDGGRKPRSPGELRQRLENQLDRVERQRVFVRVLDVSLPYLMSEHDFLPMDDDARMESSKSALPSTQGPFTQ